MESEHRPSALEPVGDARPVAVLLMVRELNVGGTERQCAELARALDRRRFQVHVACLRDDGFRAKELRRAGIPILHLPVPSFRSLAALAGARRLRRYIRENRIGIVHTFDSPMNLYGVPVARWAGAPVVIGSQRQSRHLYPRIHRWLRLTDRLADAVVVNSEALRRELLAEEGIPEEKLYLCRNAIDTAVFRPAPQRSSADSLTIGVVSVLRPEKGLSTLLEAFALVRSLVPGLRLAIVGDGPVRARLEEQAAALGLGEQCHFAGTTADVPGWLHKIDIFVLPSLSEALSNALMEAMACGCCPVASRVGGNPELVEHERTGLLFEAGNRESLAECLRRAIADAALRRKLADAAAARIAEEFSLEAAGRRLGEIYEGVLKKKTR